MTVKFLLYYRELFGARELRLELPPGSRLRDLLERLADTPRRRQALLQGQDLNPQTVILKNGVPVRTQRGLATELQAGDTIAIFPLPGGG